MPFKITEEQDALERIEKLSGALDQFKKGQAPAPAVRVEGVAEAVERLRASNPSAMQLEDTKRLLGLEE